MRISWKQLMLIFFTVTLLDLITTHFLANFYLNKGFSIIEIADLDRGFLISNFWVWTNNILLGEILDFFVKVPIAFLILYYLIERKQVRKKFHESIFYISLAFACFFFFGAIHNVVYYYNLGRHLPLPVNHIGLIIFSLFCIIGIATLREKRRPRIILTK